jgi:hypothetical protein
MNQTIRAAGGREPPDPPKQSTRVDSGPESGVSDLDVLKAIAAHEGLTFIPRDDKR